MIPKERETVMDKKILVTVARQYGSGGREIGNRVAELLGIPLYDREIITGAAEAADLHPDVAEKEDERAASSLLYTLAMGAHFHIPTTATVAHLPINDRLFMHQSDYIRDRATEGSGVFIGRCADYVLREDPERLSVFIFAPTEARCERVMLRHPELSRTAALDLITKTDRRRAAYYNFYTGGKWGKYENYHLLLDSHVLGIEEAAATIAEAARRHAERTCES